MSFGEKVKESIVTRAAEGLAVSITVILIWAMTKISPIVLPAIESGLSKSLLLSLLLASLALNIVLVVLFWIINKKPDFKLKYGIYLEENKKQRVCTCQID